MRELTAEGEAKLTDFTRPTYLAMLDELGKELGADGLEKLAPDERPDELRLALAGKKALIIFDNLETLPEEERTRLFQFLSRLPEGNKAIVTSRRRTDVDARIVRLDRLAHDEALQLIAELAAKYPRLARASQKEREDLYEITQGNPLFIRWIAGQLGREGSQCRTIAEACAFIDKAPKGNDPLEYIFGDLLETFTADETKVLAALTYFSLPAKLKWIADMTDLPERAAETALEDLTDRSILTSDLPCPNLLFTPADSEIHPDPPPRSRDPDRRRPHRPRLRPRPAIRRRSKDYEKFPMLDAEWDFISAALPRLLTGDNDRLQTVCDQLDQFLDFTGRWDDWLWLFEQAEARALAADDKENAGWRAYRAGMGLLTSATNPPKCWHAPPAPPNTGRTAHLAIKRLPFDLRGHWSQTEQRLPRRHCRLPRSIGNSPLHLPRKRRCRHRSERSGGRGTANKDYPAAERDYREALRIAKINKNNEHIAIYTGNLAVLALDREQWAEAESLAREALALAEKVGRQELIAGDCHRLAKALLKQNTVGARHVVAPTRGLIPVPPRRRDFHAPASAQFAVSAGNAGGD